MKKNILKLVGIILCVFTIYVCSNQKVAIASEPYLKQFEGTYTYEDEHASCEITLKYIDNNKMSVSAIGVSSNGHVGEFEYVFNYDGELLYFYGKEHGENIIIEINLIDNNTIQVVREDVPFGYYGARFYGFEDYTYKKVK